MGIELLAEAGNLAAVQSLYRNMGYQQQQPWAGFQPFAAMAMAAAAAAASSSSPQQQHPHSPMAFSTNPTDTVKTEKDEVASPVLRPTPVLATRTTQQETTEKLDCKKEDEEEEEAEIEVSGEDDAKEKFD